MAATRCGITGGFIVLAETSSHSSDSTRRMLASKFEIILASHYQRFRGSTSAGQMGPKHEALQKPQALVSTQMTGTRIRDIADFQDLRLVKRGPLGGDRQVGSMIAQDEISLLILYTDPMTRLPHDADVKALTRLATVPDKPMGCNPVTDDLILTSGFLSKSFSQKSV